MKKNQIKEFEEFKIENLQNLIGGEIISFNTSVTTDYPQGDNIDITYDDYGIGAQDGFGGGTCLLTTSDVPIVTPFNGSIWFKP
jgi:hypothetical protein